MNLVAAHSVDALLRGPAQGRSFADIGAGSADTQGVTTTTGGGIGAQRAEALRTVSSNRIDPPSTGGAIPRPDEGAKAMEKISGFARLLT